MKMITNKCENGPTSDDAQVHLLWYLISLSRRAIDEGLEHAVTSLLIVYIHFLNLMPLVPIFPYCTKEIKNGQASTQPAMKNQGTACCSFLLNIRSSHPVLKVGITAEQVAHATWPGVTWPASIKCHQNVHAVMCFVRCCSEKPSELNF